MCHRAIRDAKRLVERDHEERVRLETRASWTTSTLRHCVLSWDAGCGDG